MSLEKLIESHYAPKKGNELLIKLIESKLNEQITGIELDNEDTIDPKDPMFYGDYRTLKLPIIRFSKQIGKKNNYERNFLDLVVKNLKQTAGTPGERIEQRIKSIQDFFDPKTEKMKNITISNVMAYCIISDSFYHLINDYDATVSGDLFEPLFAALFEGSIVEPPKGGRNIAVEDVVVFDDSQSKMDISLKLYGEDSSSVSQSFSKMLERMSTKEEITYVVAYKKKGTSFISFYSFSLNIDNFFEYVYNLEQLVGGRENYNKIIAMDKKSAIQALIKNLEDYKTLEKKYKDVIEIYRTPKEFYSEIERIEAEIAKFEEEKKKYKSYSNMSYGERQDILMQAAEIEEEKKELQKLRELEQFFAFEKRGALDIKVSKEKIIDQGKFLGTINYDKNTLETTLQKYTDIVNKKVTDVYDSLSLLSNSINDFFLKSQGKDEKLALASIERTQQLEIKLVNYINGEKSV